MSDRETFLFVDASVHAPSATGVMAHLALTDPELPEESIASKISVKVVRETSISRLELRGALWGLERCADGGKNVRLITDCRAIYDLPARREKLNRVDFRSRRTGELLTNADLYREFFKRYDETVAEIIWVKGHAPLERQTGWQKIFGHVDRAARQALREAIKSQR